MEQEVRVVEHEFRGIKVKEHSDRWTTHSYTFFFLEINKFPHGLFANPFIQKFYR